MFFLPAFLLALSSNLDNVGVGISYGIRRIGIPFSSNLIIALVSTAGTVVSMCLGSEVARYVPVLLANLIGSGILVAVGVWVIRESWREVGGVDEDSPALADPPAKANKLLEWRIRSLGLLVQILREPSLADQDDSRRIEGREALLLALALTINNLAGGFGGSSPILCVKSPLVAFEAY
ncbi:manganese efflux pump [Desulfothermobacter acidiphilus]|uniref:manganese efflux pump n=1 Tax=Desulfothermobacter acidiphilus TaxID=1938353 RepID=UPI003F897A53